MSYPNVLLIDDDEDDQDIFVAAVNKLSAGISCTAMGDARQALTKLAAGAVTPDVIFLDLNMPLMNGQQFLMEIKKLEKLKDIAVIIFSTSSNKTTIQLCKELGAADFITKPNTFNELADVLGRLL